MKEFIKDIPKEWFATATYPIVSTFFSFIVAQTYGFDTFQKISIIVISFVSACLGVVFGYLIYYHKTLGILRVVNGHDRIKALFPSKTLKILGIGLSGLEWNDISLFISKTATTQDNIVRILLAKPEDKNLEQFTKPNNPAQKDLPALKKDIENALKKIAEIKENLADSGKDDLINVRLYDCFPFRRLIITDRIVSYSPYFHSHPSDQALTFSVSTKSVMGKLLCKEFDDIWKRYSK